jgi:formamidase
VTADGENRAEDATLAARNAFLNVIDHLVERGWTRQQNYAICSAPSTSRSVSSSTCRTC